MKSGGRKRLQTAQYADAASFFVVTLVSAVLNARINQNTLAGFWLNVSIKGVLASRFFGVRMNSDELELKKKS